MKEIRRRFGVWFEKNEKFFCTFFLVVWLLLFFVTIFIWAGGIRVLEEYDEKDLVYLEDIATDVATRRIFEFESIPEDIAYSVQRGDGKQITLTLSFLEEVNGAFDKPYVYVTFENGEIISVSRNYQSRNSYILINMVKIIIGSIAMTVLLGVISYVAFMAILDFFAITPKPEEQTELDLSLTSD